MPRIQLNKTISDPNAIIMYVDMNSFFATCEQQDFPELRGKPIGVITHNSPNACVIAPSVEAKRFGVKTGMRLFDCRKLCPQIIPVTTRPYRYRQIHIGIMKVLRKYCDDIMAKSIDEAVVNLTSYRLVYKDLAALANRIKEDIRTECGDYIKCSIGIAPNTFLAKLGTELQKPDGLVLIDRENIDEQLAKLKLTDLPGIASKNERRLRMIGIHTPLDMRHASQSLLRKAFGGIVGYYWHCRLNFMEVDLYQNDYRGMSATRTVSPQQRASRTALEGLLISLCTRLEQRLVKQDVFCKEISFWIRYKDYTNWETHVRFTYPLQDAMEMRQYIMNKVHEFEKAHHLDTLFTDKTQNIGIAIRNFVKAAYVSYTLFDNRMQQDKLRKVIYTIKDRFGRDIVRKATETIAPNEMKDAIGFGSVKDMYTADGKFENNIVNKYLLEEE